jgi:hypothetical protein
MIINLTLFIIFVMALLYKLTTIIIYIYFILCNYVRCMWDGMDESVRGGGQWGKANAKNCTINPNFLLLTESFPESAQNEQNQKCSVLDTKKKAPPAFFCACRKPPACTRPQLRHPVLTPLFMLKWFRRGLGWFRRGLGWETLYFSFLTQTFWIYIYINEGYVWNQCFSLLSLSSLIRIFFVFAYLAFTRVTPLYLLYHISNSPYLMYSVTLHVFYYMYILSHSMTCHTIYFRHILIYNNG